MQSIEQYLHGKPMKSPLMQDPFPNMQTAGLTPDQLAGLKSLEGSAQDVAGLASGGDQLAMATMGGAYLDPSTNPWLKKTADAATQNTINEYDYATQPGIAGSFAQGGALGGSAYNSAQDQARFNLANSLGNINTNIYGSNYSSERQNQLAMLGYEPALAQLNYSPGSALMDAGGVLQQQQQNVLNTDYQNLYQQANFPFQVLNMLGGAVGQTGGLYSNSTQISPSMGGKGL